MKYLQLNDISAYKLAFQLSQLIWEITSRWERFAKNTVGSQFVRAIDSISANIAEGFGRYSKKDKIHFYRIARGSILECLDWCLKAHKRKLVSKSEYEDLMKQLQELPKQINGLISYTNLKLKE